MNELNNIQPTSVNVQYVNEIKSETKQYSFLSKVISSVRNSIKEFLGLNKIKESLVSKNTNDNGGIRMYGEDCDKNTYFIKNDNKFNMNEVKLFGDSRESISNDSDNIYHYSNNSTLDFLKEAIILKSVDKKIDKVNNSFLSFR
ncbi:MULTISPECIES: hypothetical protein [Proteus]|uniref:Uncharacterized protein n=1 Tax=Proteus terrae subsp. cibarius TaxID=626774 RepID=A0A8I0WNG1_9GAMM|nr:MULTISPECIES: hypothetical protein [Proteus]MBG2913237.1 hypothetical protein [Proteus terrae subsp. cibarius]MBG3089887.1 hypothetical protein [Proteus terrae subsp. cibarius]MCM2366840.1 hypothetical protein [Proteus sp. FZP2095]MCO4179529.1 hypothetical protein [Proteus terrae]MCO4190801.1 hypothetical protein [Proteus terrae]